MQYLNRQPAEGANVTKHNPLLYFLKLMALALVFIVCLVITLNLIGASLAKNIPFRYETALMDRIEFDFGENKPTELVTYLNNLSEQLLAHLPVPDDMQFVVHYNAEPVFNAYATLGGNLVFYNELLRQMPNENALAMVMAHEMSHVLHRDPLSGLSGGAASLAAVMMLTGTSAFTSNIFSHAGTLTQLTFSRDMETTADNAALAAVAGYYGHVAGADTLFRLLADTSSPSAEFKVAPEKLQGWLTEFGSTHPLDQNRVDSIAKITARNGWDSKGELTPLPADFTRWLGDKPE